MRDDDSDYCDVQMMADDSQVNSPSVERRSPTFQQPLNNGDNSSNHEGSIAYDECTS